MELSFSRGRVGTLDSRINIYNLQHSLLDSYGIYRSYKIFRLRLGRKKLGSSLPMKNNTGSYVCIMVVI